MKSLIFFIIFLDLWVHVVPQGDRRPPPRGMTFDQLIAKSLGGYEAYINTLAEYRAQDSNIMAELDMNITGHQFRALYPSNDSREKRKAIRSTVLRWPYGEIPYTFKRRAFKSTEKYMIRVAMREWEKYTCLKFRKRTSQWNYVHFQDNYGCNSQLGMVGGRQVLNLDRNGCRYKGLYLHEIGHAIGLVHEHQRPIRDSFIRINYNNVQPALRLWFRKYPKRTVNNYNVTYEFSSVMHYGVTAFSYDGRSKTIEAQPQYKGRESEIGVVYEKELSFTDIETVNGMYGCARHCGKNKKCINGGFVDQNCRCLCPDGTSDCEEGYVDKYPNCRNRDKDWTCNIWAKQGECERNPRYMERECKRACGICGNAFAPIKGYTDRCENVYSDANCKHWKELGDCIANKRWMKQNCIKTCSLCDPNIPPPGSTGCRNKYSTRQCEKWTKKGECIANKSWMNKFCKQACHMCPHAPRATTVRPTLETTTTAMPRITSAQVTTTTSFVTSTQPSVLQNTSTEFITTQTTDKSTLANSTTTNRSLTTISSTVTTYITLNTTAGNTTTKFPSQTTRAPPTTESTIQITNTTTVSMNTTANVATTKFQSQTTRAPPTTESTTIRKIYKTTPKPKEHVNMLTYFLDFPHLHYKWSVEIKRMYQGIEHLSGICKDKYRKRCQKFERRWKFCKIHKKWMKLHCRDTCGFCVQKQETSTRRNYTCRNRGRYCDDWARFGHCKRNSSYMMKYCRRSCHVC